MLVNTKAKVGVFSIALGAYLPQFPQLVPEFEAQYEDFKKTNIPDTVEIIDGGMVTTKERLRKPAICSAQLTLTLSSSSFSHTQHPTTCSRQ